MRDRYIWLTANLMLKRYGDDAALEAARRADELLDAGDRAGERTWIRILAAVRELAKIVPDGRLN